MNNPKKLDRARVRVDFNELIQDENTYCVLLSQTDSCEYSDGNTVLLKEGMNIFVYEFNAYDNDTDEYLFADGIVEQINGRIKTNAKWWCRINQNGITVATYDRKTQKLIDTY